MNFDINRSEKENGQEAGECLHCVIQRPGRWGFSSLPGHGRDPYLPQLKALTPDGLTNSGSPQALREVYPVVTCYTLTCRLPFLLSIALSLGQTWEGARSPPILRINTLCCGLGEPPATSLGERRRQLVWRMLWKGDLWILWI